MSAGCDFEFMEYMDEKSIDANLLCHICTKPLKDPVCTPCDHSFGRACITRWLDDNGKTSCPMCKMDPMTTQNLTAISGPLRKILDGIHVQCLLCDEKDLIRGNFKDHIEKTCSKAKVTCRAADIKCPWMGLREELIEHMNTCVFESLRPVLTVLIAENRQLKSEVQMHTEEIRKLALKIRELEAGRVDDSNSESENSDVDDTKGNKSYEREENAIFVRNIPSSIKFNDLFTFFSQIGRIKVNANNQKPELFIFKKQNEPHLSNVKVIYEDKASAAAAVVEYNFKNVSQWNARLQVCIAYSKRKTVKNQAEATTKDVRSKASKKHEPNINNDGATSAAPSAKGSQKGPWKPKKQATSNKEAVD